MNLALSFYWALQQELRHILRCVFMLRTWGHEQSEAKHLPPFHDHVFWVSLSVWYALTMPNSRENRTWRIVCRKGWRHLPHCKAKHLSLHQKFGKHKINSLHAKDTPAHHFPWTEARFPQVRAQLAETQHMLHTHPGQSPVGWTPLSYWFLPVHTGLCWTPREKLSPYWNWWKLCYWFQLCQDFMHPTWLLLLTVTCCQGAWGGKLFTE